MEEDDVGSNQYPKNVINKSNSLHAGILASRIFDVHWSNTAKGQGAGGGTKLEGDGHNLGSININDNIITAPNGESDVGLSIIHNKVRAFWSRGQGGRKFKGIFHNICENEITAENGSTEVGLENFGNINYNCKTTSIKESTKVGLERISHNIYRTPFVSFSCGGWASLPVLVFLILDKLLEPIDHVHFAAVCKQWRSMSKLYNQATQRWCNKQLPPMLLIPNQDDDHRRVVYSISEGRVYNNIRLQVPFSRRCCGSSHGWLATVDTTEQGCPMVVLRNPFTKAKPIFLPPLDILIAKYETSYHEHYVRKVILSVDPTMNPENYVVVALYGRWPMLAFIKSGQNTWTYPSPNGNFSDVIFYKSKVYALEAMGDIESLDVFSSDYNPSQPPQLKPRTPFQPFQPYCFHAYLVESTKGDLLHILRFYALIDGRFRHGAGRRTTHFVIYKWVFDNEDEGCIGHNVEVKSIGDEAVFVGDNHSISILASNLPGCQPNSIYYSDDYISNYPSLEGDEPYDMGIFNLEDGTITQHYSLHSNSQRAIWVVPPFNGLFDML
ncbi:putative F-box protein At1g65770 isoform X1 [Prunus avium]|uniref:F-box protein At1g65770 isoform X1 n=1 Tax=Prunus avium TaxID=42229 RepID=A0A6P5RDX0_PRUAV|nr:putative F-box protein At1g65770 isoform X1 [Prunus avium]XP_021803103.1 putative F-box protein At1g65770 isoform X1 [Prunus avium]XP_021803104.1 putative F-box protein At1g65770 isoform X1 [Prunus avium]XP_021803105.1 putative F-box protein At1g65770 isoform X1 [Prunus avium]XP_021803111.1 putative F-box protein At1g65770 isoform X1 [Prunus avium]XP_021803112.1 putative F-box protein At1g65770 isoform X1 [Prunus avium]XP_021803113.1 putative F-box protein At1g65770 isoform X1 [Prunus aviu